MAQHYHRQPCNLLPPRHVVLLLATALTHLQHTLIFTVSGQTWKHEPRSGGLCSVLLQLLHPFFLTQVHTTVLEVKYEKL